MIQSYFLGGCNRGFKDEALQRRADKMESIYIVFIVRDHEGDGKGEKMAYGKAA